MTCDWTRVGLDCNAPEVTGWTRTGHRTLAGELMSLDGVEQVRRCADHPMGEQYGWVPSPVALVNL